MFNDRGGAARGSRPADQRCFDHAEKLMRHATIARDALEDGIVRPLRAIAGDWRADPLVDRSPIGVAKARQANRRRPVRALR
jgi:hypothetical protein